MGLFERNFMGSHTRSPITHAQLSTSNTTMNVQQTHLRLARQKAQHGHSPPAIAGYLQSHVDENKDLQYYIAVANKASHLVNS